MKKIILLSIATLLAPILLADNFIDDLRIKKAVGSYWPDCGMPCEWQWLKAQIQVESSGQVKAISPAGAKGALQFMDDTWQDMIEREYVPSHASPFDFKHAVIAGARYMSDLMSVWSADRSWTERMKLARASYNAGIGNMLKAQTRCDGALLYDEIMKCLPDITGTHARETASYNPKIELEYWRIVL